MWHTRGVDSAKDRLVKAAGVWKDFQQGADQARDALHEAILAALDAGIRQSEIVRITGYTRERIRQIARDR